MAGRIHIWRLLVLVSLTELFAFVKMSNLPGGWSEPKKATEEIQKICNQVKPEVEKITGKNYEEFRAVIYRSQVVAGSNYLIKVHVGACGYIHVKVYKHLPYDGGTVELTGVQENHTKDDHLDLFPFAPSAQ